MTAAMPHILLVAVRFHDGRYHGMGDWPPSPARLFQALVAGAAQGGALAEADRAALRWLEGLAPPMIAAPVRRAGQGFASFVPNNDLDAVGGDPGRVSEIRAAKVIKPHLFDGNCPFLYLWRIGEDTERGAAVVKIAERLYQLGRGVDMAFATAEVLEAAEAERRLAICRGTIHRPAKAGAGVPLPCPTQGSLASLENRFVKTRHRFSVEGNAKRGTKQLFTQAPKPRFLQVAYDSPPTRLLFELRAMEAAGGFATWPLTATVALVERLRDAAAHRLRVAMADKAAMIERVFIGRHATDADKDQRLLLIPLPSIGHPHAEPSIRRLLVEIPPDCPLAAGDIEWAFSGLDHDPETGEVWGWALVAGDDTDMLGHYGIPHPEDEARTLRCWRTVTPAALPEPAARRRIDPQRSAVDAKGAGERAGEQARAATAVLQALRHARVTTEVESVRVQREPFAGKGARAEASAPGTRFAKERLWHAEIRFAVPRHGPLVIGDGRHLGLGLMAPVKEAWRDVIVFTLPRATPVAVTDRADFLRAVRRALMALARDSKGGVPRLFSGHETDGGPARPGSHDHVFLAADDGDGDGRLDRLIVAAPRACDRSQDQRPRYDGALFDRIVSSLGEVRAGRLGLIVLGRASTSAMSAPLFAPARTWESRTVYRPTRHASRGKDPAAAVTDDVVTECGRRGLPRPEADLLELGIGPNGGGLAARLRLRFAVAVAGPLLLGRDSHMGGGLFAAAD